MIFRYAHIQAILAVSLFAASGCRAAQQAASSEKPPTPPTPPDPKKQVVLSVDDVKLTVEDVQKILGTLPPQSRQYYSVEGRHLLPQYLVRMKVLSQEARKQKLDQQQDVRDAIDIATESILADVARRKLEANISAPDDLVAQYYEVRKAEFEEVRLRRILIRTESSFLSQSSVASTPPLSSVDARKKLEAIRQQFADGANFGELAKVNSDDGDSAPSGGDLGFVGYQAVIPPVAQAANRLSPGQVSDIIATPYGLELYQVVEKRTRPLAEVRPQLEAVMRQGKLEEKIQDIQSHYNIFVDPEYFAPQAAAMPSPFGTSSGAPSSGAPATK